MAPRQRTKEERREHPTNHAGAAAPRNRKKKKRGGAGMKKSKTANKEANPTKIEAFAICEANGNLDVEDEGNAGEDVAGDDGLEQGSEAAGEVEGGREEDPGEEGGEGDELPQRDSLHGHHLAAPTKEKEKSQPPPKNKLYGWLLLCSVFAISDANCGRNQEKYDKDSQRKGKEVDQASDERHESHHIKNFLFFSLFFIQTVVFIPSFLLFFLFSFIQMVGCFFGGFRGRLGWLL